MNRFSGGIAVTTGTGSGIGAGLGGHATQSGMTVVLADVDPSEASDARVADAATRRAKVLAARQQPLLKQR